MSKAFREPKACIKGCGATIYFDPNSTVGHPSPDRWVPLEIKEGRKTDQPHNCPKKNGNGRTLETTTATAALPKEESIKFAETLCTLLHEYIRLKSQEVGAAAK
jgi:hypothetical protein